MFPHLAGAPLVYFIRAEIPEGLIKIGYSASFGSRFSALTGENASRLVVLGVQPDDDAEALERRLHARFAPHCDHSEWFRPVDEILKYIEKHARLPHDVAPPSFDLPEMSVEEILAECALPPLMTIDQLAEFWQVSVATLRRHVKLRKIPYVRVGGQIRFDVHEFTREVRGVTRSETLGLGAAKE